MPLRSAFVGLTLLAAGVACATTGAQAQSSGVSSEVYLRVDRLEAEVRRLTGEVERLNYRISELEREQRNRFEDMEFRLLELEGIDPTDMQSGAGAPAGAAATASAGAAPGGAGGAGGEVELAPGSQTLAEIPAGPAGGDAAAANDPGAEADYQSALGLLQRGDSDGAERAFQDFVASYPNNARGGEARFWMGEISYARADYQKAARLYLDSQQNYPEDRKAPDALLKLGMSLARLGQTREACLTLREVPLQYPSASPSVLRGAEIEGRRLNCGY